MIINQTKREPLLSYDSSFQWCDVVFSDQSLLRGCLPLRSDYEAGTSGYIYDMVHPSVVYIPEGFGGHNIWAVASPYSKVQKTCPMLASAPLDYQGQRYSIRDVSGKKEYYADNNGAFFIKEYNPEPYENPCIMYADINTPTSFTGIDANPIMDSPEGFPRSQNYYTGAYNSDPELFFDSARKKLYCCQRDRSNHNMFMVSESSDGNVWSEKIKILHTKSDDIKWAAYTNNCGLRESLSPMIISYNGKHRMYIIEHGKSRSAPAVIDVYEGDLSIADSFNIVARGCITGIDYIWHAGVFEYDKKLFMVASDKQGWMILGYSTDYVNFKFYKTPLINPCYRPCAFINGKELYVYNTPNTGYTGDSVRYPGGSRLFLYKANVDDFIRMAECGSCFVF